MKSKFIEETIRYTGEQLQSGFAYKNFGILGDSIIAFSGGCDVHTEEMVDIEDLRAGSRIYSEQMLHFIIEHYNIDLEKGVLRQTLLAVIIEELINKKVGRSVIRREGSDLYDGDCKLSISVATVSPLSVLIHFGVNISSANTPVKTRGLNDYGIEPVDFAREVMACYIREDEAVYNARCKVRWVK